MPTQEPLASEEAGEMIFIDMSYTADSSDGLVNVLKSGITGHSIHVQPDEMPELIAMLIKEFGYPPLAQLEATIAAQEKEVAALRGLEEWIDKHVNGQAFISSCWITSNEPSALLPTMSISPAWQVNLERDDDEENDIVERASTIPAAISAALAQVKEAANE